MARRLYSQGGGGKRASRTAIGIATVGVALGIAVMLISVSVVMGFKHEVQNKVTGIGSHIRIVNYETLYKTDSQPIVISDSLIDVLNGIPGVRNVQRFCQKTGMLKTDESFQGVLFRGIAEDYDLAFLRDNLVDGRIEDAFSSKDNTGRLLVSQKLARQLGLKVGSNVFAYFFDNRLRARKFSVEAIYATNLSEYDSKLVFCDYKTVHQLMGYASDQCSGAEVNIYGLERLPDVSEQVFGCLGRMQDSYGSYYASPTIKDSYPHIFAWLDLLDLNIIVILILMVAVAGFTTISGLLIIILERTQFIGVMKALGATNRSLRHIFIYYAVLIIGRGMLLGNLLGLGLCLLQQYSGLVRLDAETYYVEAVPVQFFWIGFAVINLATFLISVLALLLPSFVISNIHPAKSIRFE